MKRRFSASEVAAAIMRSDSSEDTDFANSDSDFEPESSDGDNSNVDVDSDDNSADVSAIVAAPAVGGTVPNNWVDPAGTVPTLPAFTGRAGVLIETEDFTPLDFWKLYVDDDLMNHIVCQTNLYAEQVVHGPNIGPMSRKRDWSPTTKVEMYKFFGLLFLTGLVKKPQIAQYWSTDPLYTTPLFGKIMTRNRFQLLLSMLHYNDNSQAPRTTDPNRDRLYKIRPVLDHLFERFQAVYGLSRDIAIDESLLLWKGRLLFKQYLPLKRSRFGIKLYKLCESYTGYTYRFRVYPGKDSTLEFPTGVPQPPADFMATEKIVWHLVMPLLNLGHHLYVDNFYTSIPLFKYLFAAGTCACGTIRANRKGYPQQLTKKKQKLGDVSSLRSGPLLAVKFTDKKDVHMLSTIHDESVQTVPVRRRAVQTMNKPLCILEYNKAMGGVDRSDQLLEPYDATRKTMTWYKKLAIHLFQLSMLNAHIVYQKSIADPKPFMDFTHDVIGGLLFNGDDPEDEPRSESIARITGRHFIERIPPTNKERPQKRCRVCWKNNVRRETRYYCPQCPSLPGLCLEDCFKKYHTSVKY